MKIALAAWPAMFGRYQPPPLDVSPEIPAIVREKPAAGTVCASYGLNSYVHGNLMLRPEES